MRNWQKALLVAVAVPFLIVGTYIGYLAATYIDETVTSGSAYGFDIGASRREAVHSAAALSPNAVIYVNHGPRAGDNFSVQPALSQLSQLEDHNQWKVLVDGDGEFFNIVRLTFREDRLVEIHRHRQYFELP